MTTLIIVFMCVLIIIFFFLLPIIVVHYFRVDAAIKKHRLTQKKLLKLLRGVILLGGDLSSYETSQLFLIFFMDEFHTDESNNLLNEFVIRMKKGDRVASTAILTLYLRDDSPISSVAFDEIIKHKSEIIGNIIVDDFESYPLAQQLKLIKLLSYTHYSEFKDPTISLLDSKIKESLSKELT